MKTNAAESTVLPVSETIFEQLGGSRFRAMTGARDFVGGPNSLQFKLPRGAKDGINAVRVTLDPDDTYTVAFYKMGRHALTCVTVASSEGVYCDQLQALFTRCTGLYTSL